MKKHDTIKSVWIMTILALSTSVFAAGRPAPVYAQDKSDDALLWQKAKASVKVAIPLGVFAFAENGHATLKSLDAWEMKSIW
jgi:hypothetical protein